MLNRYYNVNIFGVEPELDTDEHKKWDFLYKRDGFTIYHPNQADEVAEKFISSRAGKFL